MEQLSLMELLESQEDSDESDCDIGNVLSEMDVEHVREELLIESVRHAFGESRGGQKRRPSDDAWEWLVSEEKELPFSFEQCCHACGVDSETMLDWLRYYKRKWSS